MKIDKVTLHFEDYTAVKDKAFAMRQNYSTYN